MPEKETLVTDDAALDHESDGTHQLPVDWQERAQEAAHRFGIPLPGDEDLMSSEQAEQRLREFEQEGGQ